ncbi:hypothetical protein HMPREF9141_1441 [Prevotella multiformis DSM 16608]|uniref:Uncharacterized protein n=1 Tax=Prevotella multiformis DSM 16608 TaxID=888743 RepID=F0F774_9BACT|nr:hypothetical protein HMPREF9141_1441 [Prevotella multiformis DSM 16608]
MAVCKRQGYGQDSDCSASHVIPVCHLSDDNGRRLSMGLTYSIPAAKDSCMSSGQDKRPFSISKQTFTSSIRMV